MADDGSTTRQAATDEESRVHRLCDIVVEEVSLVDRAANKRRFLLVKRSSQMANDGKSKGAATSQDSQAGGDQGTTGKKPGAKPDPNVDKGRPRVMRAASEDEEDDEDTETTRGSDRQQRAGERTVDAGKAASGAGGDSEDDETEEDEEQEADDDQDEGSDQTSGAARSDKDEGEGDDGDGDGEVAPEVSRRQRRASAGADGERRGRGGKPAKKAENDAPVLSSDVKNAVLTVLAQALDRLVAVANQINSAREPGDQGASMPGELVDELESIGGLLEDIGEQLADVAEKSAGKKAGPGKGRAARTADDKAGGAKAMGAKGETAKTDVRNADVAKAGRRMAKERLDRFRKALELLSSLLQELTEDREPALPSAGSAEGTVAKRAASPETNELVASVHELTRIVKRQEEQLVRMQKTRATSNAIPVDGGGRRREIHEVSWPLDMNRPISRDRVDKAISFYDED